MHDPGQLAERVLLALPRPSILRTNTAPAWRRSSGCRLRTDAENQQAASPRRLSQRTSSSSCRCRARGAVWSPQRHRVRFITLSRPAWASADESFRHDCRRDAGDRFGDEALLRPPERQTVHEQYTAPKAAPQKPIRKPRVSRAFHESGRQDLNLRPPGPQPGALPDCATPRGRRQAGDGNRTRPRSLEGFCATTTLRPQARSRPCYRRRLALRSQTPIIQTRPGAPRSARRRRRQGGRPEATARTSCRERRPGSPPTR